MDDAINDARNKGLIEIVRKPRSEKLAELIRTTKAYTANTWLWLDYLRLNKN